MNNDFEKIIKDQEPDLGGNKEMQRTAEWFEQRRGKFTGSGLKNIFGVERKYSKKDWSDSEKMNSFNETALNYIYEKAMEIKYGYIVNSIASKAMQYGSEFEPIVKDYILTMFENIEIEEVGFIEFIEGLAGSSPDGLVKRPDFTQALEIKCATDWPWVRNRILSPFDYKHADFWQIQAEMLALNVDSCLYVVALPPEDIFNPELKGVEYRTVYADESAQELLKNRILAAEQKMREFLTM